MLERLRRWREERGRLPEDLRAELEVEGLVLVEERLRTSVIFRGYEALGQRPRSGHQSALASIALTERRLVVHGTGATHLEVPRESDWLKAELPAPDRLKLSYDAAAAYPQRSGDVELELETPRAADIHARLEAWMPRQSS
jgi:hypothetical protein